jgi:glucosamine--fructose-6-phosphate aminotransferase (isomerizing)
LDYCQTPEPYAHWTIKEILEQPESIYQSLGNGSRIFQQKIKLGGIDKIHHQLLEVQHLIILGCGTSHYAGQAVGHLFKKFHLFTTVQCVDASEFYEYLIPLEGRTCAIFVSQSGETKDLYDKIEMMKKRNVIRLGVVNVVDSYIAREMDAGVYLHIGREVGVASTKAFTSQVICLILILLWFVQNKQKANFVTEWITGLEKLADDVRRCIEINHGLCKSLVREWAETKHLFVLAKEDYVSYAHEGSLKLKEIGYIHAEAYSSSALKHGPYALIEKGTPVILLCPKDEHFLKHQSTKEEIIGRGGKIIGISNVELDKKFYRQFIVPNNPNFYGLLANIVLQMLAYELSVAKGINPDKPRNLAKVVTVD